MKKALQSIFSILFLLLSVSVTSQSTPQLEWVKQFGDGTTGLYHDYSIATDNSGGIYIAGTFQGTNDFDPGPGVFNLTAVGFGDFFICKLDEFGNFVWVKQFIDSGDDISAITSISVDDFGNIFMAGIFNGTVDFDPSQSTNSLTSFGGFDSFVGKLDSSGNLLWVKQIGGGLDDLCTSFKISESGDIYLTGYFQGSADFDPGPSTHNLTAVYSPDFFVCKLDASGNFVWAKQLVVGSHNNIISIAVDDMENVYVTGRFEGTKDFDPGPGVHNLSSIGERDIFICKLNVAGDFVWARNIGGTEGELATSISLDYASGDVYISGFFHGTADFDPGPNTFNMTSAGESDGFITKLDPSGDFLWAKSFGGVGLDQIYTTTVDALGYVYVTGFFVGTVDFDPSSNTFILVSGSLDGFITKLDSAGNFQFAQHFGESSISSLALDLNNNIYLAGSFAGTVDFDPSSNTHFLSSMDARDSFVLKLNNNLDLIENFNQKLQIYPNPISNILNIASTTSEIEKVWIYDLRGRKVWEEKPNVLNASLNLENLESGTYVVKIDDGEKIFSHKIIKE